MHEVAAYVRELVLQQVSDQAVVIALAGDLGAGKTTFTQAFAKQLGVSETVTSPTYVVMKKYEVPAGTGNITELYHIDAYRIEDIDEMRVLRFDDLLSQKGTIICIEWPERIASLIPKDALAITIEIDGTGRTISIS